MHISRLIQYASIILILFSSIAMSQNVKVDITAEYIVQRDYMVSRPMDCNWDPTRTTIFGYYGTPIEPRTATPNPMIRTTQKAGDVKSQLTQHMLDMPVRQEGEVMEPPYRAKFGSDINLAFVPEMMERYGMPLHLVEIDYKPLNRDCSTGFSPGMMTR